MFALFRALRAGGSTGPGRPPRRPGPGASLLWAAFVIAVIIELHWWLPVLCVSGALMVILIPVAIAKQGTRESKPDPLAEMLARYDDNGRRK
jgi:hypothetical protein